MKPYQGWWLALAVVLSLGGLWVAAQQGTGQRGGKEQKTNPEPGAQRVVPPGASKKDELPPPTLDKAKAAPKPIPRESAPQPPLPKVEVPAKKPPFSDPTDPAGPFQELLTKPERPGAVVMPAILLKGRVIGPGFSAVLLEVDGKLQMVAKDSSFSSGGLTFRVEEVSAEEVRLLALPRKEVLILH